MKRNFFRVIALILCIFLLQFSFVSCKNETVLEDGEVENPFRGVIPQKSATVIELEKNLNGEYVPRSANNTYDVERFWAMLKECRFFEDSENFDSVEISHLVKLGDISFFVSTDLSRIYISRSSSESLMQREVAAYRVEGFGGMSWKLLITPREELSGLSKYLNDVIGINLINHTTGEPRCAIVQGDGFVEVFYDMLESCTLAEAEEQDNSVYKYYCTVAGKSFKLSDDLGGYRYMCDVKERIIAGKPIELAPVKTYRVEGFGDDIFEALLQRRETSFFQSLKYYEASDDEFVQIWQRNLTVKRSTDQLYALRDCLSECDFVNIGPYENGYMQSFGAYISQTSLDYTFYVSATDIPRLIVFTKNSASDGRAVMYDIIGVDSERLSQWISSMFQNGGDPSTFNFWLMDESNFN